MREEKIGKLLIISKLNPSFIHAIVCRIGLAGGDEPYIVPLCFGYEDRTIYLHSALAGKKISMLKKNSRCCFEVDQCDNIVHGERPCDMGDVIPECYWFWQGVFY